MKKFLLALLVVVSATAVNAQCPFTPTITTIGAEPTCNQNIYRFRTEPGNTNYQWNVTGGNLLVNGYDTVSVKFVVPGAWSISVKYTKDGCTPTSPTVKNATIVTAPAAVITATPSAPGYCSGTIITYSAPTGPTISGYRWVILTGSPIFAVGTLQPGSTLTSSEIQVQWTATAADMHAAVSLQYLDTSLGTCKTFGQRDILISKPFTTTVAGPSSLCLGNQGAFTVPDAMGDSQATNFVWTITGSEGTNTISTGSSNTLNNTWSTSGLKNVSVTYTRSGPCPVSVGASRDVTVIAPLPVIITGPSNPVCVNTFVDYVATPGFSGYSWQISTPDLEVAPGYNWNSQTIRLKWTNSSSAPITVRVVAINASGCGIANQVAVTTKGPGLSIAAGSPVCASGSTIFNVNGTITGTPAWSVTGGTVTSSTSTSATVNWTSTYGARTLTFAGDGTTPDGCTITSANPIKTTVVISAPPSASGFIPSLAEKSLCTDGTILFSPGGPPPFTNPPPTYSWGVTAPDIFPATTNQQATGYSARVKWGTQTGPRPVTLTLTDGNGCKSAPTTLNFPVVAPPVVTITGTNAICSNQLTTLTANGGSAPYTWSLDGVPLPGPANSIQTFFPGIYTVSSTPAGACTVTSAPFPVTVVPVPTVVTDSGITWFCEGSSLLLKVQYPAGIPYQWKLDGVNIPGATSSTHSASTAGAYSVTTTTPVACLGLGFNGLPFNVTKIAATVATLTANKLQTCSAGGTVQMSLSGSTYGFAFSLERINGTVVTVYQSTFTGITNVPAGTYRAKATSPYGCIFYTNTVVITDGTTQVPVFSPAGTVGICSGKTLQLSVTTGMQSYQWHKSGVPIPGATSATYDASAMAAYSMAAYDANGCYSYTNGVNINTTYSNPTLALTATGGTTVCSDTSAPLSATTGLTYKWYKDAVEIPGQTAQTLGATQTGSYTVAGKDANGCSTLSNAIPITVNTIPSVQITPPGPVVVCGGTVALAPSANTSPLTSYEWKRATSIVSTTSAYTADQTGSYTLKGTDPNGCKNTSSPVSVTINTVPTINISGSLEICPGGGQTTLTASGGATPYVWKKGTQTLTETSASLIVWETETYTATYTDGNSCTGSKSVAVSLKTVPSNSITSPSTTVCAGGTVVLTATDGDAWQWRKGGIDILNATLQQYPASAGVYTCIVWKAGCLVLSIPITITENPLPTPTITNLTPLTTCGPVGITLRSGGGSSYQWRLNGAPIGTVVTATDQVFTAAGVYSVDAIASTGCVKTSTAITYTINAVPSTPTISVTGATTFCQGGTTWLSTPDNGNTFYWYRNGVNVGSGNTYPVTTSGSYHLVSQSPQGCLSPPSGPISFTVVAIPVIGASATSFCSGGSVSMSTPIVASAAYSWYRGATLVGAGAMMNFYEGGTYTVKLTLPTCSMTSAPKIITMLSAPAVPSISQVISCTGGSATLTGNVSGTGYEWYKNEVLVGSTQSINVTSTGTYKHRVKNANNCWSAYGTAPVASVSAPTFQLTTSGTLCVNGQVTINVVNVVGTVQSRSWSPSSGSAATIVVYSGGTYTCTINFTGGCQVSRSVYVQPPNGNCHMTLRTADDTPTEIPSEELDAQVTETSFFPNPADREINLTTPAASIARKISLINMQGVEVHTSIMPPATTSTRIPLGSLSDGMYLLQIQSPTTVERLKVMINQKR